MDLPRRLIRRVGTFPRTVVRVRRRNARPTFDLFTDRALIVLALAQDEAKRLGHDYIGTEHLLLGLIRERGSVAGRVLKRMGVRLPAVRSAIESIVGRGQTAATGELRLTPRAKRALERAGKEAQTLKHGYVGTEHLLLGLIHEAEGVAARILVPMGVTFAKVHAEIQRIIGSGSGRDQRS